MQRKSPRQPSDPQTSLFHRDAAGTYGKQAWIEFLHHGGGRMSPIRVQDDKIVQEVLHDGSRDTLGADH